MTEPLVSILIPCYNAAGWVAEAIESALAQTYEKKEIIVVDDGSADGSLEEIKSFGDKIRWQAGPNRGANVARNRLLELSQGEWLQYLDADDYLLRDKITRQMEFLASRPRSPDVILSPVLMEHWSKETCWRETATIPEPHDLWVLLATWRMPQTGGTLWRKQALIDMGGWQADLPCCQEYELYLRLLIGGKQFDVWPENGAIYRQWSANTLCKQNTEEVHRQSLAIECRLEEHLRNTNQLTPERSRAINQARFEIARGAWQYKPEFALDILEQIRKSAPDFLPAGTAAPAHYRFIYRWLGFQAAERLADLVRRRSQESAVGTD